MPSRQGNKPARQPVKNEQPPRQPKPASPSQPAAGQPAQAGQPKQISVRNLLWGPLWAGSPYVDLRVKLFHILRKWSTATPQYATILDMILRHSILPEMMQLLLSHRKYAIARLFVRTVHLREKLKYKFGFSASLCQSFLRQNMSIWSIRTFSASSCYLFDSDDIIYGLHEISQNSRTDIFDCQTSLSKAFLNRICTKNF